MTRILLLVAVFGGVTGCAVDQESERSLTLAAASTMRDAAGIAEERLGVPADLVLALAWVETQWAGVPADAHEDHDGVHAEQVVGVGGIRPWLGGDLLAEAERALGATREDIDADPALGVLATAVVLRELALARHGEVPSDAGAYYEVLGDYLALDHDRVRRAYAERVLAVLEHGVQARAESGEEITVHARAVEVPERVAGAQGYHHAEYEGAHWVPAREGHYRVGRSGYEVTHIIIHTMQGTYEGAISWFRSASNPYYTSTQYLIRSSDGDITQMVHESDTAHHIGGWNPWTIGIEHEGWVEDPGRWYTETMYQSSARLVRHLCDKYGVPIDREHILGHVEVPGASHTDPGPGWDWDHYMDLVHAAGGPPLPAFAATFVGEEYPAEMIEGDKAVVWFELQNDGARTWSLDTTRLGTVGDRPSPFVSPENWLSDHRATPPDHSTYTTGTVGRFTFEIIAPEVDAEETLTETFQLVDESGEVFGPEIPMTIRVLPRDGGELPPVEPPVSPDPGTDPDPDPATDPMERPGTGMGMVEGGCSAAGSSPGVPLPLFAILLLVLWRGRVR